MKLNPCKECGKEPAMYDVSTKSKTIRCMFFQCPNQESIVAEETQAIIGWNAMNPVEVKAAEKTVVLSTEMTMNHDATVTAIGEIRVEPPLSLRAGDHVKATFYSDGSYKVDPIASEPAKEECGNCGCYDRGSCLRYPPTVTQVDGIESIWPSVLAGSWCGEWRAK